MIFRIFIAVIALACSYFIYDGGKILLAKYTAERAENSYVSGPENSDITVVEFLDYGCSHCQNLHPILMRALTRDGKIRYIPRPIPSAQGENGTTAARMAYAAGRQGQFINAHTMLIENFRPIDDLYIANFAAELDLDIQQLQADMEDPEINDILNDNLNTLKTLKGHVVPALLIDKEIMLLVTGTLPDTDELLSLFNRARTL